jgi:hypothetical protein
MRRAPTASVASLKGGIKVRIRRHLSYANVGVTVCLFLILAGGLAYATGKIGSHEIQNDAVKSIDLRNHKAVRGKDVVRNSLRGGQIAESSLDAEAFAPLAGDGKAACDLAATTSPVVCAKTSIRLKRRARLFVVATGGEESSGAPTHATCAIRIDGTGVGGGAAPGEEAVDNTSGSAQNGFALTIVTAGNAPPFHDGALPRGRHAVALTCQKGVGSPKIDQPQISVLAIAGG